MIVLCCDMWYGREDIRKTGVCVCVIDGVKRKKSEVLKKRRCYMFDGYQRESNIVLTLTY